MRGRSGGGDVFEDLAFLEESSSPMLRNLGGFLKKPEDKKGFAFYSRWIPEKPDHGKVYMNLSYQVTDSLRAGLDWRPLTGDVSPLINFRAISEDDGWRPALILGMSNDDFGNINSDSYYATLSKHAFVVEKVNVSVYGGGTFVRELDEIRPVGGIHWSRGAWSGLLMYSGVDEHVSISRRLGSHTVTFLMFDLKLPGMAYSFTF
ncbi:MAG: hypothetical protein OSA93_08260 [Akkermansiaceae bacterium]|nr:hypothetical protein [Akkermansiaceae bacterium]